MARGGLLLGQDGDLAAALADARRGRLELPPEDLPTFAQTSVRSDLPLDLSRNDAALLLVDGSERILLSSWTSANPGGIYRGQSLIAPGRGVSFGCEDRLETRGDDGDFNDLIVTLTPALPTLLG